MVKRQLLVQILRRCVQIGAIALLCVMPILCKKEIYFVQGSFFSLNLVGIPFADPVGMVQALPQDGEILEGVGMTFLVAFLLGRVFCGWVCPYGFFSELLHSIRSRIGGREGAATARLLIAERVSRLVVLLLCLVCTLLLGYPLASFLAMPGNLSIVPIIARVDATWAGMSLAFLMPVAGLAVELLIGKRVWCRFFCPQAIAIGAVSWLAGKLPVGVRVGWDPRKCTCRGGTRHCERACSLCLTPRGFQGASRLDCTLCGDCVRACRKKGGGALHWQWGFRKGAHATPVHPVSHAANAAGDGGAAPAAGAGE